MQDIATNEETLKKMKKSYNDHATFRFRGWVLNCFFFCLHVFTFSEN